MERQRGKTDEQEPVFHALTCEDAIGGPCARGVERRRAPTATLKGETRVHPREPSARPDSRMPAGAPIEGWAPGTHRACDDRLSVRQLQREISCWPIPSARTIC